jgi:hypothetical protein
MLLISAGLLPGGSAEGHFVEGPKVTHRAPSEREKRVPNAKEALSEERFFLALDP